MNHKIFTHSSLKFISGLAELAIEIRESIKAILKNNKDDDLIYLVFIDFKKNFIPSITENEFAELYAQILVYIFFIYKITNDENCDNKHVYTVITQINPEFKILFSFLDPTINKDHSKKQIEQIGISKLLALFESNNAKDIFKNLACVLDDKELTISFYETFLKTYNPEQKNKRGVFFTPKPVTLFIIRIIDEILINKFDIFDGLLDIGSFERSETSKIQILDPATGIGTFLLGIIDYIKEKFDKYYSDLSNNEREKKWIEYIPNHLLARIFGFEVLFLPYIITQLNLDLKLRELNYTIGNNPRPGIYFTNALEREEDIDVTKKRLINWAVNENYNGKLVKETLPITVILGNPPYSGLSANHNAWINGLLKGTIKDDVRESSYFSVDGIPLKEKKIGWIYDDYVKFIRFGQWKIEKTGYGIIAYVTNHSYIDNPTFRGMRQQLLQSFSNIYIINLHGNYKKKEGYSLKEKNENIFDIQQGVAISIFIKNIHKNCHPIVYYYDLWGSRQKKYQWLQNNTLDTIKWRIFTPKPPFYLFVPLDENLITEYEMYWKITDIMPLYSSGLITSRDNLTIKNTPNEIEEIVQTFIVDSENSLRNRFKLKKDGRDWKIMSAKADIINSGYKKSSIVPILYRPFDIRYTYFTGNSRGFHSYPRRKIMAQFLELTNYGLISGRSNKSDNMDHFLITNVIAEAKCAESTTQSFIFPLQYKEKTSGIIKTNMNKRFILEIEERFKFKYIDNFHGNLFDTVGSLDILNYIYAIFYSSTFRKRYKDLLKVDYPRVPLTSKKELFIHLSRVGEQLIKNHLMKDCVDLSSTKVSFTGEGDNIIQNINSKSYKNEKLYINKTQFFDHIPEKVYTFTIGGYKICEKWLKDRKGKHINEEDISYYIKIIVCIRKTLTYIEEIDQIIEKYSGWPIR